MEITENKLKDILTGQREEFQRHVDKQMDKQREEFQHFVGIMKEDFDSKMQLIGEQYQDIKATLDNHSRILDSHTEMIGSLAEDMQIVKSDIQFIKGDLKRKVDYDEFAALAKRVSTLEAKIRK